MFNKVNIKVLTIVFVVLLAVVIIMNFVEKKKGDRSFKKELVDFAKDDVTKFIIKPKSGADEVYLTKTDDGWNVSSGDKEYNADVSMIDNMLTELINLKSKRLAATSKEKWKDFEVTDSTATRVIIKNDDKKLADIYIGKFSYQQPKHQYQRQGTMLSYVRLAKDKNVHAVDGFLSMTYNRDVNAFRNKNLINTNKENVNKIAFNYQDSAFTMLKQENHWMINGLMADSLEVDKYLGSIVKTSSPDFVDNVDVGTLGKEQYSMVIEGDNFLPVNIKVYNNLLDTVNRTLVTSSFNKGTVFSGSKSKFNDKLFVGKGRFIK